MLHQHSLAAAVVNQGSQLFQKDRHLATPDVKHSCASIAPTPASFEVVRNEESMKVTSRTFTWVHVARPEGISTAEK